MARIEFTKDTLSPNLKRMPTVFRKAVYQVLRFHEPQVAAKARANAPWKDDTGNARSGLSTEVVVLGQGQYALVLFHRVKYGLWLEVRFEGRYAIIMPTLRGHAPLVMASYTKLLEKLSLNGSVS